MTVTDPRSALEDQEPPVTRRRGAGADVLVVLGCLLVLGILCGVLWWLLVDPAEFVRVRSGGAMGEVELGKRFDADGWYVVLAFVAGLPAGAALTWWRDRDPVLTTGLLVVGSVLAAVTMALVGHLLGPANPTPVLAAGKPGLHVPMQLAVSARSAYLVWPIGVLLGSLLVLWSKPLEPEL